MFPTVVTNATGMITTGNPNSTTYVTVNYDENNNPIQNTGVFVYLNTSYATGYLFAMLLLAYCQATNK